TAIDTTGFRFAELDRLDHPMFVPGAAKYHDLPGLIALCAPARLQLGGEGKAGPKVARAAYAAAGKAAHLQMNTDPELEPAIAAVRWIMRSD
ncbi:MAG: acetylxylan esterase, partial [Phycisphaerae bacterium]|nr:acetylxylan esterase [Phycisphaerae bacterium]